MANWVVRDSAEEMDRLDGEFDGMVLDSGEDMSE